MGLIDGGFKLGGRAFNAAKGWFKGGKGGKGVKPPKAEGKPLDVFQKLIRVVKESRLNPLNLVEKH